MLDARTGQLVIGSKGDAAVYMVLRHKTDPQRTFIKRISSPVDSYIEDDDEQGLIRGALHIAKDNVPIMRGNGGYIANSDYYDTFPYFVGCETGPETLKILPFEVMNIKEIENKILAEIQGNKPSETEDYDVSIIVASDGITGGKVR